MGEPGRGRGISGREGKERGREQGESLKCGREAEIGNQASGLTFHLPCEFVERWRICHLGCLTVCCSPSAGHRREHRVAQQRLQRG